MGQLQPDGCEEEMCAHVAVHDKRKKKKKTYKRNKGHKRCFAIIPIFLLKMRTQCLVIG